MNTAIIFISAIFLVLTQPEKGKLIVTIEGITITTGTLIVGLFDNPSDFPVTPVISDNMPVNATGSISVVFNDVPYKQYAISVYQDVNNNGKLDKNMVGMPTEPYGFSNNPRIFMGPDYEKSTFDLSTNELKLTINLH